MSEAFSAAQAEAEQEEADFVEPVETEEEGEQPEAKATDWEKIAHDAKGQVAKERSRRKAETSARRELEARLEKLESAGGKGDPLEELVGQLRNDTEDPINDIEGVKAIIRKFVADQKAERETSSAQSAQQRQAQELINTMGDYEADFASDHPDYHDAAKHYRAERQAELEELGYSGQALQQAALARDLFGIVQTALQSRPRPRRGNLQSRQEARLHGRNGLDR